MNGALLDIKRTTRSLLLSTGSGARVAVLDSGVNPSFAALSGRVGKVFDCVYGDDGMLVRELPSNFNSDRNGHGSFVQSCIQTVAPDAAVDHFRILDEQNNCDSSLLCYALDHVIERDYKIINLSLGTRNEDHIPWLVSIMKRAYERQISVVAACSNLGNTLFPARFTYCISVDATTAQHPLQLRFKPGSVVEFSAWGVNVPVTGPNSKLMRVSGSSYAAAHVTGLCARVLDVLGEASPLDVKMLLREYALALEADGGKSRFQAKA